jgi:hypothetical protein
VQDVVLPGACSLPRTPAARASTATSGTSLSGLVLTASIGIHVGEMGNIEGIRRGDSAMSSASWRHSRQLPSLLHSKKGGESGLPTCVHCHVAKSNLY